MFQNIARVDEVEHLEIILAMKGHSRTLSSQPVGIRTHDSKFYCP